MRQPVSEEARIRYDAFRSQNLNLNMTRGKPSPEQLDLSAPMLRLLGPEDCAAADGTDCRNYGVLEGLPECRALFGAYLGVEPDEVLIGGNASLNLMWDAIVRAMLKGVPGGSGPWSREKVKFLCPAPGYDRHFNICQGLDIEMITVPMDGDGPVMERVERLVAEDASIKGMWCVPRYSNPTGITYSDEVVDALARMRCAAPDFRIFWDNAYQGHHLVENPEPLKNILTACKAAGNPDRVLIFGSTSKMTFAGGGVSAMACSRTNLTDTLKHLFNQTIGFDKLNQLRHVRFFRDLDGLERHMARHRALLKPKFDVVDEVLTAELGGSDLARWTKPDGGYFISLDTRPGLAAEVVRLADEAGVKLTAAGATYPYGHDPDGCNIRIAPSFPSLDRLRTATEVLAVCIHLAAADSGSR